MISPNGRQRHAPVDACSFVPRAWYGDYLRSLAGPVEHLVTRAVGIEPRWQAGCASSWHKAPPLVADRVVLAPGFPPPRWPADGPTSDPRWIVDPWGAGALSDLRPAAPVLLLGTGPTAVDVAVSLHNAGHRQILATSRHGLLPLPHPETPFAPMSLQPPVYTSARHLLAWAHAVAGNRGDWRPVIDALRPHADRIWGALSVEERARLLRLLARRWEVGRHRMAPAVAQRVEAMRNEGSLTVIPGGIRSAHTNRSGVAITLADRHVQVGGSDQTALGRPPTCDARPTPLRATPPRTTSDPPLGLGLGPRSGTPTAASRAPMTRYGWWDLLRRGESWETTAMPEIRAQATQLARSLWRVNSSVAP